MSGYLVGGSVREVASLTREERAALMRAAAARRAPGHSLALSISDDAIGTTRCLCRLAAS